MSLPHVTDHALIRYIERVQGIDLSDIREHIAQLCAGASGVGARTLIQEGHSFIIKGQTVVTVRPIKPQNPRRVPRDRAEARA